ncbi:hypothetical protein THRCLA_22930 [Thraustotheca clavata]|uniref:Uncharacterized protein n=1 Tax=Thraustotheca clavata TaxID=74557 RepID=A0A1V9YN81_9STRA|nr:hypothetical protein THRCLA_22930 [Thraustotheca clavata]
MGTDAKIQKLYTQSTGGRTQPYSYMSLIRSLPKYQLQIDESQQEGWSNATTKYPFLVNIVKYSRGRFARHFIDKVAECWVNGVNDLFDLMDEAFAHVSKSAQED